jgi:uncharacterized protein YbjT (DUF2867 family)
MTAPTPTGRILVIGATGRHANTGGYLVRRLRAEGRAVRVLARTPSERTQRLAELGAEIVIGDLHDRQSLVPALTGVDLAYFTYPIADGVVLAAANYAAAVREVGGGVRTVVMSMGPANPHHPSLLGKAQWLAEQVMEWAGLDLLILRVTAVFHENIVVLHRDSIRRDGVIRNCFGPGPVPWINGHDAAELAYAALIRPERFDDGPVIYPLGAESVSHGEIAELLSELLGRVVRFEPVTQEQWARELLELCGADAVGIVNPAMAQHISTVGRTVGQLHSALPINAEGLRQLIGREPVTLRDYLEANLGVFEPAANDAAGAARTYTTAATPERAGDPGALSL